LLFCCKKKSAGIPVDFAAKKSPSIPVDFAAEKNPQVFL
jgi:hypothetical protein